MFEKLKEAYVKARYSKHYRITAEELAWLGARVEELGSVVQAICIERIEALKGPADSDAPLNRPARGAEHSSPTSPIVKRGPQGRLGEPDGA